MGNFNATAMLCSAWLTYEEVVPNDTVFGDALALETLPIVPVTSIDTSNAADPPISMTRAIFFQALLSLLSEWSIVI